MTTGTLLNRALLLSLLRGALVHGSGLRHMIVVIGPRPGVTTDEVPEA